MAFMLIVPEAFKLLFREEYYEALVCIPPVTMGVYFLFLYTIFVDIESYYGKTNYIAYVSTFCAVLNIVLNYIGMKFFSYVVCAYTTLICYAVMSFLHFVFMKQTCKAAGLSELPLDARFVWMFSFILIIAFVGINSIYSSVILRYSLLTVLLTIVFVYRKKIKRVLSWVRS